MAAMGEWLALDNDDVFALVAPLPMASTPLDVALAQPPRPTMTPPSKVPNGRRRSKKLILSPKALALKRARRSEIERRSRLRRLDELQRMRDEAMHLEFTYRRLAARDDLSHLVDCESERPLGAEFAALALPDRLRVQRRLQFVVRLLEEKQQQLHRLLDEHRIFQDSIQSGWTCELSTEDEEVTGATRPSSPTCSSTTIPTARCYAFVRETFESILRFHESEDGITSSGASFMGWSDRRRIDPTTQHLQYGFRKAFPAESAENLLTRTWEIFRDDRQMWRLLIDPAVTTKYETLQILSDDLFVVRRDHAHACHQLTFVTVHVLFRLRTAAGFVLCFRTIAIPAVQEHLRPGEIWFDVFHWTMFHYLERDAAGGSRGCEVISGGTISDPAQLISQHWFFELIVSVLRWESHCVRPLFLAVGVNTT